MGRRMTADRTSTVILSDVMHEDMNSDALYRSIAELLQNRHIDRVIGIGPEIIASRILLPEVTPSFIVRPTSSWVKLPRATLIMSLC